MSENEKCPKCGWAVGPLGIVPKPGIEYLQVCGNCGYEFVPYLETDAFAEGIRAESDDYLTIHKGEDVADLRRQLAEAQAKVNYAKDLGLEIGVMRSSDRLEPYLAHSFRVETELGQMNDAILESIDLTAKLAAMTKRAEKEAMLHHALRGENGVLHERLDVAEADRDRLAEENKRLAGIVERFCNIAAAEEDYKGDFNMLAEDLHEARAAADARKEKTHGTV